MIKLIKAKIAARKAIKARLKKEIPMINELIEKASQEGDFNVPINVNEYSNSARILLEKAGYDVNYNEISWAHLGGEMDRNEKELKKIAEAAGVKILEK